MTINCRRILDRRNFFGSAGNPNADRAGKDVFDQKSGNIQHRQFTVVFYTGSDCNHFK